MDEDEQAEVGGKRLTKAQLGRALRRLRKGAGLSQGEVDLRAREIGLRMSAEKISRWENGRGWPSLRSLADFLAAIGRDVGDLHGALKVGEVGDQASVEAGDERSSAPRPMVAEVIADPEGIERLRDRIGERRLDHVAWRKASPRRRDQNLALVPSRGLVGRVEAMTAADEGDGVVGSTVENEIDQILGLLREKISGAGYTQLEVQARYGWGRSYISQILTKQKALRVEQLLKILDAINVSLRDFVAELYEPRQPDSSRRVDYDDLEDQNRWLNARLEGLVEVLVAKGLVSRGEILGATRPADPDLNVTEFR